LVAEERLAQCGGCGAGRELVCRACDGVHDEDDALHESKCMVEHEGFHLAVDPAAPVDPLEERPPDLDLGFSLLEVAVSGAADDTAQGVLLPDQRISPSSVKDVEVTRRERAQLDEVPFQMRL